MRSMPLLVILALLIIRSFFNGLNVSVYFFQYIQLKLRQHFVAATCSQVVTVVVEYDDMVFAFQ